MVGTADFWENVALLTKSGSKRGIEKEQLMLFELLSNLCKPQFLAHNFCHNELGALKFLMAV